MLVRSLARTRSLYRCSQERVILSRTMADWIQCAPRIADSKPSVWVEFTALAKECGAVNIGQGFPDYSSTPAHVTEKLAAATVRPENVLFNQYTRGFGHIPLVTQLGHMYSSLLGRTVDPLQEILVTVGAYQALFYAVFAFIDRGDEAIIIEPYYDCYEPQVKMAGGVPVFVPLRLKAGSGEEPTSADLELDFDALERKISPRTKLLFLNNPHNPTGKLFSREELMRLADIVSQHNIIVISDEVYEWLTYKPNEMIRFASLPGMWERTVTVGSAGKTFSVTGWKTGWAVAPAPIMHHIQLIHQNCVFTCPTILQEALARSFKEELALLGTGKSYFETLSEELRPKRDRMARVLRQVGMVPLLPQSGYFMMADYSKLKLDEQQFDDSNDPKDYKFVRWLTRQKKLAGIPPSAFYSSENKHLASESIRFCFFKKDETLDEAEKILQEWVKESK